MNATKGPLRLRPLPNSHGPDGYSLRNDDDQGQRIGIIYERAYAVRVVKAVNNFDAVLGALEAILEDHDEMAEEEGCVCLKHVTENRARAVIAKVKEE